MLGTRRTFLKTLGVIFNGGAAEVAGNALGIPLAEAVEAAPAAARLEALDFSLIRWLTDYYEGNVAQMMIPSGEELDHISNARLSSLLYPEYHGMVEREEELRALKPTDEALSASLERISQSKPNLSSEAQAYKAARDADNTAMAAYVDKKVAEAGGNVSERERTNFRSEACGLQKLDPTHYSRSARREVDEYDMFEKVQAAVNASGGKPLAPEDVLPDFLKPKSRTEFKGLVHNLIDKPEDAYRHELAELRNKVVPTPEDRARWKKQMEAREDAAKKKTSYEYVSPWERMVQDDKRRWEEMKLRADELGGKNTWGHGF